MLGTPWPPGHSPCSPPEAPYGLGKQRSLEDYEGFAGLNFAQCRLLPRAQLGGLPAEHFAPLWADEQREKMLLTNQLKDVESWAGKGGATDGANLDLLRKVQEVQGEPKPNEGLRMQMDLLHLRIDSLLPKLPGADVELELCKAFAQLAQLSPNGEASGALAQAERYLSLAKGAPAGGSGWEASIQLAEASIRLSQQNFATAKAALLVALSRVATAIAEESQEATLKLAFDIVEAIHRTHERTDDRQGLQKFHAALQATVSALQTLNPEKPMEVPALTASSPPPEGDAPNMVAMVLERMVLVLVATGQEKDMELVKKIYQHFRVARQSPPMLRLLAMLQSSGHLLRA